MTIIFSILILLVSAWGLNEFYRLHRLSKIVSQEINLAFTERTTGNRNARYPDIRKSYANLKWYDVFNYKFKSMIVYDTSY